MSRPWGLWLAGLLLGLLGFGMPAPAAEQGLPVAVAEVRRAPLYQEIPLVGSVLARRVATLSAPVEGLVRAVRVDEGDAVTQGDALIRLDAVLADLEVKRAQAALQEAQARHREAVRRRDEAAELVKKRHVAATAYKAAVAEAHMQQAAVQRLEAEYQRQLELLRRHVIYAPYRGIVGSKHTEQGQWLARGDPVLELVEIDWLRIEVSVPQRYYARIRVGTPVELNFDALPDQLIEAGVTAKIAVANPTARTFPVRIELENKAGLLAPGMSARVTFRLQDSAAPDALLLPRDAVVASPAGSHQVWRVVAEPDDLRVEAVKVVTGRSYRQELELLEGELAAGDRLVVRGNETLQSGQRIRISHVR